MEARERQEIESRRNAYSTYKVQLGSQMVKNEEQRQNDKANAMIEAKKNSLTIDYERNRINMIKAQKISGI